MSLLNSNKTPEEEAGEHFNQLLEWSVMHWTFSFWQSIPLIVIGDTNFFEALIQF